MFAMFRRTARAFGSKLSYQHPSRVRTATSNSQGKKEGTIADSFASLSGQKFGALEPRFATLKAELIKGNEKEIVASWNRLLVRLQEETETIQRLGSAVVPQISFKDIDDPSKEFSTEYRKRGCAVIKGVIPQEEVAQMKAELRDYIGSNPSTKGTCWCPP